MTLKCTQKPIHWLSQRQKTMQSIRIIRPTETFNKHHAYRIILNGTEEVTLENGQSKTVGLEKLTTVQAKTLWCGSKSIDLENSLSDNITIEVTGNRFLNQQIGLAAPLILLAATALHWAVDTPSVKYITTFIIGIKFLFLAYALTLGRDRWLSIQKVS